MKCKKEEKAFFKKKGGGEKTEYALHFNA